MALTRPPVLPVWADTGDKTQPTNPEIEVGWPVTDIPPSRQRFNWFFNFAANAVRYLSRRGLSDWDDEEFYQIGDRCISPVDQKSYKAILGGVANQNFEPSTNPLKWERWGFTWAELLAAITANAFTVDSLIPYMQTYGMAEIVTTNVSWADGVSRTAGTNLLGSVVTRTFTNSASVPRKLLVQYFGAAAVHDAISDAVGVLGYAERSVNGAAYAAFTNSQYTLMQCWTGGFSNESCTGSGMASEVFTIAPGATLTLAVRQRLNFYITTQGPNTGIDVAYERGSWSFTYI